jgi:hypothetical protein
MTETLPQSRRANNPWDRGYKPTRKRRMQSYVSQALTMMAGKSSRSDSNASRKFFRVYAADVIEQYTKAYYGDEGDPELIAVLVERMPHIAFPIFAANVGLMPTPTAIEVVFDDLVAMDGVAFCTKYNIMKLYDILTADDED